MSVHRGPFHVDGPLTWDSAPQLPALIDEHLQTIGGQLFLDVAALFSSYNDGVNSDHTAIQLAVSILENTGGVIWLDPRLVWAIGESVIIQSLYPISIVSAMAGPNVWGSADLDPTHIGTGHIKPLANLTTDGIFKWVKHASAATDADVAGPHVVGLVFIDPSGSTSEAPGDFQVHSCINFTDTLYGRIRDCRFFRIKGRALYFDNYQGNVHELQIRWCGDDANSRPVIELGTADSEVYFYNCQIESSYDSAFVGVAGSSMNLHGCYFEQTVENASQAHKLIVGAGAKHIHNCNFGRSDVTYVEFETAGDTMSGTTFGAGSNADLTQPFFTVKGNNTKISDVTCQDAPGQVAHAVNIGDGVGGGVECSIIGLRLLNCGRLNDIGLRNKFIGCDVLDSVTTQTYQVLLAQLSSFVGGVVKGGTQHAIGAAANHLVVGNRIEISTINKHGVDQLGAGVCTGNHITGFSGTGLPVNRITGAISGMNFDNFLTYQGLTVDPPSLLAGASATGTITATGAAIGDMVSFSPGVDLAGVHVTASVSSANNIRLTYTNTTGSTVDLASSTWLFRFDR